MCMANFGGIGKTMAKILNESPSNKLRQKIAVNDPLSRELGYVGLADPLGDEISRAAGSRSEINKRARRVGDRQATAQRDANYKELVYNSSPGHVRSIRQAQGRRS